MQLNGSDVIVECLVEQGVDTIFGYPGGAVLNIYDALYKNSDRIRHIITAHEQAACHAADGYSRTTGKTGVVLATSGPGATNLVTGIATAYMDSVPMVAITGNVTRNLLGLDSFQGHVHSLAHVLFVGRSHHHGARDVHGDFAMALVLHFVIQNDGGSRDVRVELCQFVHFFLNPILETGRCIKMTGRKLNIHCKPPYVEMAHFDVLASHLEYIHLFL